VKALFRLGVLLFFGARLAVAAALALHPENPHYFLFRGQPTVIITSGEHYGAVLNLDFNYGAYLNELQARGLNGTRTFTGVYFEPQGAFNIAENTLAPANGRYIGPWMRTLTPGATHGGTKFDLTRFNDSFFARLRDFVRQASQRGVIVEMNLFCPFYEEVQWNLSPMNSINNVNNIGQVARTNVYTLDKNGGLLPIHDALVRRIVLELNQFDNLYYEICNEPYFGGVTLDWQRHISQVIVEAERTLPNKHLISQNIANGSASISTPDPLVSIFNFHYAAPPNTVEMNYHLNKVIGDNETGFRGTNNLAYRREAWEFILAGGGLFNNLDYSFTVRQPAGTFVNYPSNQPGGGNPRLREEYRVLRNFINKFDFVRMAPDTNVIRGGLPTGASARALSQPEQAYAIYLGPSTPAGSVDQYSVRWTGKLRVPRAGNYTFYTLSNDGVRLFIGGSPVIDNWTPHSNAEDKGAISLEANKPYDFRLEYFQAGGNAVMRLAWQPPGSPRLGVPPRAFVNSRRGPGLDAEYFTGENFETLAFKRVDLSVEFDWTGKSPFEAAQNSPAALKTTQLEVNLPRGDYLALWINTLTGATEKRQAFAHNGGARTLASPPYAEDIALDLRRAPPRIGKRLLDVSP
jgi:hypothetical protein